jgi:polyphosphate kinase
LVSLEAKISRYIKMSLENPSNSSDLVPLPESVRKMQHLLFNRELSWLKFNRRVLEEAVDPSHPLLEQLKFLSIFSTNLDEFFMIRVAGLKAQVEEEVEELSPDGMTPGEQLRAIREQLLPMIEEQTSHLNNLIFPQLRKEGILIVSYESLSSDERARMDNYFMEEVFPVLTPQAVDPAHPFPYISNRSLNVGLVIKPFTNVQKADEGDIESRFARVKVPPVVPRLVAVNEERTKFTVLEELIIANISALFPGVHISECHMFRVTRDADIEVREDEASDLLKMMEQELRQRHFGDAARLEVCSSMPYEMVDYLTNSLGLTKDDVYVINGPLNIPDLLSLYQIDRPELKDRPFHPTVPTAFKKGGSIFNVISQQDVLVHHPYDSFSTVIDFIKSAAADPDVLAIKMTLYRAGQQSPIVQALIEASESDKQVAALVELKARFDEENNIEWARQLEDAGVHVVYGLIGLKTHCKLILVVRREAGKLKRYIHIGTGNYNPSTSRIYTDIGLFTTDREIGEDATELFNYLTGCSLQTKYKKLLIAPINMRKKIISLIKRETKHREAGHSAHIIAKINSLTDPESIRTLYEASQSGVRVDLIVRGICMLKPGIPGLSENIKVISIVGRFLEHSRVFYFANAGNEEIFIGSADWMIRNLDRRVELASPIIDPNLKRQIKEEILDVCLKDNVKARRLLPDGTYEKIRPVEGEKDFNSQLYFMNKAHK